MTGHASSSRTVQPDRLAIGLLGVLMTVVTLSGGASFPDVVGQAVVRTAALFALSAALCLGLRFAVAPYRAPLLLLLAMIVFVALQLVPLPPALWLALPGRKAFDVAPLLPEVTSAWRPAAIVPEAAWNALFALFVPASVMLALSTVPERQIPFTVPLLVAMVVLSSAVATLQFAGGSFENPLINDRAGFVSGLLANRNHQALFLGIGVVTAMQWGATRPFLQIRAAIAALLVVWFVLMILATGSRAGLLVGGTALAGGGLLVGAALRRSGLRPTRRQMLTGAALIVIVLTSLVTISLLVGRSESIDRLSQYTIGEDMRVRALPVVLDLIKTYMPVGAGQGGFAVLFKAVEPDALLKPTYFNRAHNDFLEVALEGGVIGVVLLATALIWFAVQGWRVWRLPPTQNVQRARLGTIIILLVLLASTTDYPARTPLIMSVIAIASSWLVRARA